MKYSVAVVLAAASSVLAYYPTNDTVVYTTEVVDVYTTVCPAGGVVTVGGNTYTNTLTESSYITVTDCPCTISKPVYTTSAVAPPSPPVYPNATTPAAPVYPTTTPGSVGTTSVKSTPAPTTVPASGANKAFAMSGASLAGLLGLAAYLL